MTTTDAPEQAPIARVDRVRGQFNYVFTVPPGAQRVAIEPTAWGETLGPIGAWSPATPYRPVIELRLGRGTPRGPLRLTVAVVLHDPLQQLDEAAARAEAVELLRPIAARRTLRPLPPAKLARYRDPLVNHVAEIADADPFLPEGGDTFSGLFATLVAGLEATTGQVGLSMLVAPARDHRPDLGLDPRDPVFGEDRTRPERQDRQVEFRLRVFSENPVPATLLARAEALCISRRPMLSSWRVPLDRGQLDSARRAIAVAGLDLWGGAVAPHPVNPRIAALTLSLAVVPDARRAGIVDGRPHTGPLPTTGAVLGKVVRPDGRRAPWRLGWEQRRLHVMLAGASGCGKTTMIKRLVLDDIAAHRSVVLVDPHGDVATELAAVVPPERLVLIDPRREDTAALDLLDPDPARAAANLMSAVREMWPVDFAGPTYNRAMFLITRGLDASTAYPGPTTLVDVERFVTDHEWREGLIAAVPDRALRADLEHEHAVWVNDTKGGNGGPSMVQYISSKFAQLTQGPARTLFARPPGRYLEHDLADGAVVIVALPLGLLGTEGTRFAARMFLTRLTAAIAAQGARPENLRRATAVFLDEAALMTGGSLAGLFAQSRKWGVAVHLAVQAPSMLGRHLEEILTNTQTQLLGRLGAAQAAYLVDRAGQPTARMLPTLPRHHVAVVTEDHDPTGDPLVLTPVPPPVGP